LLNRFIFLFLLTVVFDAVTRAQTDSLVATDETNEEEMREPAAQKKVGAAPFTEREGTIADTTTDKILGNKDVLKPSMGFQDIFMTRKSAAFLDVQKLGKDVQSLCFRVNPLGIVTSDATGVDKQNGGFRIQAGDQEGTAQVLVYDGITPCEGDYGELLRVYRITVTGADLVSTVQELKALIGNVEGIQIRIIGTQIVVDGDVLVPKDMRRVLSVLAKYQTKNVINLVEMSPLTMRLLGEKMEEEIAGGKERTRDIRVKVVNGRFFLEGNVDKRVDREVAEKICQSYVSERYTLDAPASGGKLEKPNFASLGDCVSMIRIRASQAKEPDPIINVRVDFVTLNRNYLKNFDFQWAPGISTQGGVQYDSDVGRFVSSFVGTITNLFPKLDSLSRRGYARVLKTAFIPVRDGDDANGQPAEATVSETLSIGFVIPGNATQPPQPSTIPVTTSVSIRARSVAGTDRVNLGIKAVQTEVRDAKANAPPTTLSNNVDTQVVVPNGESAAVGGLIAERRTVSMGREPGTSPDVTLFKLDRAQQFLDDKTQFVIFVTPTKMKTTTEGTETLKRKFRLRK
jgi:pilus assembly protein CpaC